MTYFPSVEHLILRCRTNLRSISCQQQRHRTHIGGNTGSQAGKLDAFFAWVFTAKSGLEELLVPEASRKLWSKEDLPSVEDDQFREHLNKLDKKVHGI